MFSKCRSGCLTAGIRTAVFVFAVNLSWNNASSAYDSHYMYGYSDTLILGGAPSRRPTLEDYEQNAIKQFGVLLSKLKISATAKIRLHLDNDGRVKQIIFLEGSPSEAQLKELSRLVGQHPFGIVPDYVKSGGLTDLVFDLTASELDGTLTRQNLYICGGMGELIALSRIEQGKVTIPTRPPMAAYDSSARAYDDEISKIYSQLPAPPHGTVGDDDHIVTEIADLCASLQIAKPADVDNLLQLLSIKIQACPVYGTQSPSVKRLKSALKEFDQFCSQLMQQDLGESRTNVARVLQSQKMDFQLALKSNGYDSSALYKLCDLLTVLGRPFEASILYKHGLDCLKRIDAHGSGLQQLQQKYAEALTLAGKPDEAAAALADIKAKRDAELVESRKNFSLALERLLNKPNQKPVEIIGARLDYSASLRREGNLKSAKEELARALVDAEALPQGDAFVPWQMNLDRQIGALAGLRLSDEEQLIICKIFSTLEQRMKGGFSSGFTFYPNDDSDLKELVIRTIVREKEKKFGPQSEQLEPSISALAGHLETKQKYKEAEALRKTLLAIKEDQARIMTTPPRIQLAIVQLKAGDLDAAKLSYQAVASSLPNTLKAGSNNNNVRSALLQLVNAFVDARDLSDANACWRTAFKMQTDTGYEPALNKLLAAYVAEKNYDKAFALLDFLIGTIMQETGHEATTAAARRRLTILALQGSMDNALGSRTAEFKTLSESKFSDFIHLCDTLEKPDKQFWKTQKSEAIQERIDELRLFGRESDAEAIRQEYDIK